MSTATATPKRKQPKERARFVASLADGGKPLKITLERMREVFDAETGKKQPDTSSGRYIYFTDEGNGLQSFETDDPDLMQELRVRANTHGNYEEVPIPKPPSAETLSQIIALIGAGDQDALLALYEAEQETHNREDVLTAIETGLEALR